MGGSVARSTDGLIGMLATGRWAFPGTATSASPQDTWHALGHEVSLVVTGITPAEHARRSIGLMPFDVLVWGAGEPSELRDERAKAVRIGSSAAGTLSSSCRRLAIRPGPARPSNELHDIMPAVTVARKRARTSRLPRPGDAQAHITRRA